MKTLILLFACLAAANAATSYCYTGSLPVCVYPPSYCFQYYVLSCRPWYTTHYYMSVLKVYPGEKCACSDFKEMTEEEYKTDCETKLSAKASIIHKQLEDHHDKWHTNLDKIIDEAIAKNTEVFTKFFQPLIDCAKSDDVRDGLIKQRDALIKEYNDRVRQQASEADTAYHKALNEEYSRVQEYQNKILDAAMKCFKDRAEKIAKYNTELYNRITKYTYDYKHALLAIADKKTEAYRKLLYKIHGSETWEKQKVDDVVYLYRRKQYSICHEKTNQYKTKLYKYADQLKICYRCALQCYTYSGCLSYDKSYFYKCCRTLGCWWKVCYDKRVGCYRYLSYKFYWKYAVYKNLKTCDLNTLNKTKDAIIAEMKQKVDAAIATAQKSLEVWKAKWEAIHAEYYKKFVEIMQKRHDFLVSAMRAQYYCRYGYLTYQQEYEIKQFVNQLKDKLEQEAKKYIECLKARLDAAIAKYNYVIDEFKARLDQIVENVAATYQCCLDARDKKISCYSEKIYQKKYQRRQCLADRIKQITDKMVKYYTDMMEYYHCDNMDNEYVKNMIDCYKDKIKQEGYQLLYKYDQYWNILAHKLVHSYACCCRCHYCFAVPCFGYKICWKVCYPVSSCYTYKYNYWCTYKNYSLRKCGNYYVWTK